MLCVPTDDKDDWHVVLCVPTDDKDDWHVVLCVLTDDKDDWHDDGYVSSETQARRHTMQGRRIAELPRPHLPAAARASSCLHGDAVAIVTLRGYARHCFLFAASHL